MTSSLNEPKSSIESRLQTDLSIFNHIEQFASLNCADFKSCIAIHRLLAALRYYQSLKFQISENDREILTTFINEVYEARLLIQDFHHFQKQHDQQLYDIINYATKTHLLSKDCDIDSCDYASRHYRVENNNNIKDNMDPHLRFYTDTLDSFHFYISHLHHVGLRYIQHQQDDHYHDDKKQDHDQLYDHQFARIHNIISSTRNASNRFNRVSVGSKFNIEVNKTIQNEQDQDEHDVNEYDHTYLDTLWQHLYKLKIKEDVILKLVNYSKYEEYDTETMNMDSQIENGNIAHHLVHHQKCFKAVTELFNKSRGIFFVICPFIPFYAINKNVLYILCLYSFFGNI